MRDKTKRREELMRAARVVFATQGYHNARVEDIAAAAKVAKGTFYLYFRDKRSIFEELMNRIMVLLQGAILTVDVQAEVEAQVKHNIRGIVALFLDDPTLPQLLLGNRGAVDPELTDRVETFFGNVRSLLHASLVHGQQIGIVAHGDARLYASFALGALKEILMDPGTRKRAREDIVSSLYDLLSHGFLRTDPAVIPVRQFPPHEQK